MIARTLAYAYYLKTVVGKSVDVAEKGCQDGSLRDAILEALYLLCLPLEVVRVKL